MLMIALLLINRIYPVISFIIKKVRRTQAED